MLLTLPEALEAAVFGFSSLDFVVELVSFCSSICCFFFGMNIHIIRTSASTAVPISRLARSRRKVNRSSSPAFVFAIFAKRKWIETELSCFRSTPIFEVDQQARDVGGGELGAVVKA